MGGAEEEGVGRRGGGGGWEVGRRSGLGGGEEEGVRRRGGGRGRERERSCISTTTTLKKGKGKPVVS